MMVAVALNHRHRRAGRSGDGQAICARDVLILDTLTANGAPLMTVPSDVSTAADGGPMYAGDGRPSNVDHYLAAVDSLLSSLGGVRLNRWRRATTSDKLATGPRYAAWQRRQLRVAAGMASLTLAIVLVVDAVAFAGRSSLIVTNNRVEAAMAAAIWGTLRRSGAARPNPWVASYLVASIAIASTLVPLALIPGMEFLVAYLPITMIAVALFAPWSLRWHVGWLLNAVFAVSLVTWGPVATRLGTTGLIDLFAVTIAAAFVSVTGYFVLERQRQSMFRQRQQLRHLNLIGREQQRRLTSLASQLEMAIRRDPLTGVGNRLRLGDDFLELRRSMVRSGRQGAAIMLDLDRFKDYNDLYGHLVGDEALRRVAAACSAQLRPGDRLYRFGGEEFLVLATDVDVVDAVELAERLRRTVAGLGIAHLRNAPWGVVTLSGGVAGIGGDARGIDEWVGEADAALYAAKDAGRNRVERATATIQRGGPISALPGASSDWARVDAIRET